MSPRRSVLVVACLVASALAACGRKTADAVVGARERLEGCKRSATSAGVQFTCSDFRALVGDHPGTEPADALGRYLAGLDVVAGIDKAPDVLPLTDGRKWEGMRFSQPQPGLAAAAEGRIVAGRPPEGGARVVSCMTLTSLARRRCDGVMEVLAETGAAPWSVPPDAPTLAGEKVTVPRGCDVKVADARGYQIVCAQRGGEVMTNSFRSADEATRTLEALHAQILGKMPGAFERPPRDCRIAGEPARCRVVSSGDGAYVVVLGAAAGRAEPRVAICGQPASLSRPHPVCERAISF